MAGGISGIFLSISIIRFGKRAYIAPSRTSTKPSATHRSLIEKFRFVKNYFVDFSK
jgi:hypothetical protein